jgi:hypothetical protein
MDGDHRSIEGTEVPVLSERRPRRSPAVVWNEQDFPTPGKSSVGVRRVSSLGISFPDTGIAVLMQNQRYYTLNRIGSLVWTLLDGTRTEEQIAREVLRLYNLDQELALLAVRDLLDALRTQGLLEDDRLPVNER